MDFSGVMAIVFEIPLFFGPPCIISIRRTCRYTKSAEAEAAREGGEAELTREGARRKRS